MSIKRILVVDNDRFFVEIITDILEEMGHHIQKVYDGMEAMQKLRKDIPDVIFTDLVMPKVDGERLIKYVRDNSKSCTIPIIIISGTVIEDNLRLKNIGADGFIPKGPVEKLKENITKVLEKIDKEGTTELLFEESATNVVRFKPRHVVKELLFSKRHGDLIIQKMTEGVIETDHNSMIINVNPQIIEIFQKKDWELVGTLIFDIFKAHNKERVKTIFKKLSQSPTMISKTTTISFNNKNLKLNFTNLIENNEYTGMLILIQDITPLTMKITRLKALNIKLEEAQAQLLQTAKFVALGELTANVSHEINNPLTTILGYASLLLRSLPHDDPNRKSFEIIENEAVRARSIISSLLDLAYQPEPVYEEIHIEEEIRNALPLIQKSCESA
ncbi:MAG: response regulator, partial [Thermodesulfobacteriota bacterium]|nr:response regulator [Thermodesulfobacteriota bacterium]